MDSRASALHKAGCASGNVVAKTVLRGMPIPDVRLWRPHHGIRREVHWLPLERACDAAVKRIEVGKVANLPLFINFGSEIGDMNRYFGCQLDLGCLAEFDHLADLGGRITLVMGKQYLC